jgi:hypothetical protein
MMDSDEKIYRLWKLLDDIDTLDDAAKNDALALRNAVRVAQKKRWQVVGEAEIDKLYERFYPANSPEITEER